MNTNLQKIIMEALGRNALQVAVGFGFGVYYCTENPQVVSECKTLFGSLAPLLASAGGIGGVVLSIFNSVSLWKEEPPAK